MTETGMVMVTNVPGLPELRRSVLTGAHTCSKVAKTAKTVQMNDHTNRTTLAGVTHGLDSAQEIEVGDDVPACSSDNFIRDVTEFRSIVAAGKSKRSFKRYLFVRMYVLIWIPHVTNWSPPLCI